MRTYFLIAVALLMLFAAHGVTGASGIYIQKGDEDRGRRVGWIGLILILVGAAVMRIA